MELARNTRTSWRRRVGVLMASAALLSLTFGTAAPVLADPLWAVIDNGTVQLGVFAQGHLNAPAGIPSAGGTSEVGLRYLPTNNEATAPGCTCEGWGAADATSGVWGSANDADGIFNIAPISFTVTATSAVSVVEIGETLRVTHDYHPTPATPNLYEVSVTIENISESAIDARYRRVMDWDIEPTPFDEFVTIQRGSASALLYSSNDGFAPANPLDGPSALGVENADVVDFGPDDHGALFDFGFGTIAPAASVTFKIFYGAAGNEVDALAALAAVGAEAYSFGQANVEGGPSLGIPNTFIFAFAGIGGAPIVGGAPTSVQIPAIAVTKSASASNVTPGSSVTYTYQVTNASIDALLSGISVSDDKCAPVSFGGGDADSDGNLQIGETWTYTCVATLSATTTNTATASGSWRGRTVTATASATVTVGGGEVLAATATPQITLPPTSTIHEQGSSSPGVSLPLVLLGLVGFALVIGLVTPMPARGRRREGRRPHR